MQDSFALKCILHVARNNSRLFLKILQLTRAINIACHFSWSVHFLFLLFYLTLYQYLLFLVFYYLFILIVKHCLAMKL